MVFVQPTVFVPFVCFIGQKNGQIPLAPTGYPMEPPKKYGRVREAALETIRICQDRKVLKKYLKEREKEVVNIVMELFNQELVVKQCGEEMKEKGRNEMTQLLAKLFSLGKSEDAEKAAKDPNYMRKLLKDYGLAEG